MKWILLFFYLLFNQFFFHLLLRNKPVVEVLNCQDINFVFQTYRNQSVNSRTQKWHVQIYSQVYQISYVIIKSANSPRPGLWILEKSLDGEDFQPWQYFARNDKECIERYGIVATKGKHYFITDSDVICTSYHSKLTPMENGEVSSFLYY